MSKTVYMVKVMTTDVKGFTIPFLKTRVKRSYKRWKMALKAIYNEIDRLGLKTYDERECIDEDDVPETIWAWTKTKKIVWYDICALEIEED